MDADPGSTGGVTPPFARLPDPAAPRRIAADRALPHLRAPRPMWNAVRVKCTLRDSTEGVTYMEVDGGTDTVKAETCDECGRDARIFQGQKDVPADAAAHDLGSLGLDMPMQGTRCRRGAYDLVLFGC